VVRKQSMFFHCKGTQARARPVQAACLSRPIKKTGGIMAANKKTVGYYVQMGGIASFALGAILSFHHVAIGAAFIGGAAAFYVGQKIQAMA